MSVYFGGVEGGVTNTFVVIINEKGKILGRWKRDGCNPFEVGNEEFIDDITEAIKGAKADAGLEPEVALNGLGLCVSGAQPSMIKLFREKYSDLAKEVIIHNDTIGSLASAFEHGGIVLIAGTGSNCVYMRPNGEVKRCGGWGNYIADEGSAWWIAHRAIKYLFDDDDDFKKSPACVQNVRNLMHDYFKVENNSQMLEHFYTGFKKSYFAGFCKVLSECALTKQDQLCKLIFKEAGSFLADYIMAVLPFASKQAEHESLVVLCTGSVWKSWSLLKDGFFSRLKERLSGRSKHIKLLRPVTSSAIGAALLASKYCGIPVKMDLSKHTELFHQENI